MCSCKKTQVAPQTVIQINKTVQTPQTPVQVPSQAPSK